MCVLTALTKDSENTQICFCFLMIMGADIDDRPPIVIMGMAVPSAVADGTGFQLRVKLSHEGIEERF